MPGIIQFTAVEYYANDAADNVEDGIANMNKIVEEQIKDRQTKALNYIDGETFVKPKATNIEVMLDIYLPALKRSKTLYKL